MAHCFRTENSPFKLPAFFTCPGEKETFALGESLAPLLEKGSIVALKGSLGAGKTCFAKGVARGLGIEEVLTSPTYTVISEYGLPAETGIPALYHIDAYRLKGNDDFIAIGGEDIIFADGISLIEWSERIGESIPAEALRVDIEIGEGGERLIRIYAGEGN